MFLRKTRNITLTILTAIAASACDEDLKHCVDENGVVQDEAKCADAGVTSNPQQTASGGTGGGSHVFWYYGGGYSSPQSPGTKISGGSYSPSPGVNYSPPSIGRGGFGGTGEGFGGAGG